MKNLLPVVPLAAAVALSSALAPARADVTVESPRLRAVIGADGAWQSLVDKRTDRDWCCTKRLTYFCEARFNDGHDRAQSVTGSGRRFTVKFAKHDTSIVYETEPHADWVVFKIHSVQGVRPTHLTMIRLSVNQTTNVGPRLNIAWDDDVSICLMSANHQAYGAGRREARGAGAARFTYASLRAYTQDAPGPKLEGAAMALIVCPTPEVRSILHRASLQFGLLTNTQDGVPVKELPLAKQSYWFISPREKDADKMIEYCRETGFKQVMMGFGSWAAAAGHYPFKLAYYPDGKESLKRFVDKLRAEGITVGMHTFASKVAKRDPYVTPIPDKRFWKDMQVTLGEPVTADQTAIRVEGKIDQWPGSPACKRKSWEGGVRKHQEVILGDEIVQYDTIGPPGAWNTFLGCKRGAWGTTRTAHPAGMAGYHYGVDGCINGYIIDQETGLLDEVTARLADIFNYCGFGMVYFDGGEDVDRRRYHYYVTGFQEAAMRKFTKRPIVHCGTAMTHRLWHSFARSGTVDHYVNTLRGHMTSRGATWLGDFMIQYPDGTTHKWRTVKGHIDKSVRRTIRMKQDMMPSELGWFGIWPKSRYSDGLQLDEAEYLMVKSLAYDVPISLQTGFANMEAHPLTPQILQIVKTYESLRAQGTLDPATRERLKEMGKDFILARAGQAPPRFVQVHEMPQVAGTHNVRAFVGEVAGPRPGAVATLWHYVKDGKLTLKIRPGALRAASFTGEPIPLAAGREGVTLQVDNSRATLFFDRMSAAQAQAVLADGVFEERQPVKLWVQAEGFKSSHGKITRGSQLGVSEPDAYGDVVVSTGGVNYKERRSWYCEYTVNIPHKGRWTFWGRVRYPSGTDQSFGLVPQGEEPTLSGNQVFGNCGRNEAKWHWTGRGGGSTTLPPGVPIRHALEQGPFTFRVYVRESGSAAKTNPRLDCMCIVDDSMYMPTDEDAAKALKR